MDGSAKLRKIHRDSVAIIDNKNVVTLLVIGWQLGTDGLVNTAADTIAANGGFFYFFRNDNGKTLEAARIIIIH